MTEYIAESSGRALLNTWKAFTGRERFGLTLGSIVCVALALWVSRTLHIPADVYYAGAVFQQSHLPLVMGAIWLLIIVGALLSSIFTRHLHYDAGLFCSGIGLFAMSIRFGPARYALLFDGAGIYFTLVIELLVLYAGFVVAWLLLRAGASGGLLPHEPAQEPNEPDVTLDQKLMALAAQAILTTVGMMIFCQSDAKPQVLASLAFSAIFATVGAHHFIPTRPSIWYWSGPVLVGVIGYTMQYFSGDDWQKIGDVHGLLAPLARPMPLDYAGVGAACALLGYWTSQRWRSGQMDDVDETP